MDDAAWWVEQEEALQRVGYTRWSARSWRCVHKHGTVWITLEPEMRRASINVHLHGPRTILRQHAPTVSEVLGQTANQLQIEGEKRLDLAAWLAGQILSAKTEEEDEKACSSGSHDD